MILDFVLPCCKKKDLPEMSKPWLLGSQLLAAIENNDVATVEQLLDNGMDVDILLLDAKPAVSVCIERGRRAIAKLLIDRGCSVNLSTWARKSPLHLAVLNSDEYMIRLLLENGADQGIVDILGKTPLHVACHTSTLAIVSVLLGFQSGDQLINKPDIDGRTPLMLACYHGDVTITTYLLERGGNVNAVDKHGNTPLICAAESSRASVELVSVLLHYGASINATDNSHETALLKSFYVYNSINGGKDHERDGIREFLIDSGININIPNVLGQSALHLAVSNNNERLTRKLLNAQADVNAADNLDHVPLFYACRNGNEAITEMLIDSGTDLRALNCWKFLNMANIHGEKSLYAYVVAKSRECPELTNLCKRIIHKHMGRDLEKHAIQLPLPPSLISFITNHVIM